MTSTRSPQPASDSNIKNRLTRWVAALGLRRLPGFLVVGASGVLVNTGALWLFTDLAGLHYLASAIAATQISTTWNFIWHERLVFHQSAHPSRMPGRYVRYLGVNNLALLLRAPLLAGLVEWLGVHYVVANLLTLALVTGLRFLASQLWIWGAPRRQPGSEAGFSYRIHGLVTIRSDAWLPELQPFLVADSISEPDLRIHLGPPTTPLSQDSLTFDEGLGSTGFRIWLDRGERFDIYASTFLSASPHVLYTNVVEPILRWTLVRKGYALVHAAAVSFQGRGGLITAATDTGKTTTVLRTLESQSWNFLSDDMSIISRDGDILAYPKPMTISSHTLRAVRHAQLHFRERLFLPLQSRLHSRSGRHIGLWLADQGLPAASLNALVQRLVPPPKYAVERLVPWASKTNRARLHHLVLITRDPEAEERLSHTEIVDALIRNADDAYGFPPYADLEPFLSAWDGNNLHKVERAIITQATRGCLATRLASMEYNWWMRLPSLFQHPAPGRIRSEPDTQPVASG